ncbi:phage terminase small subunit [Paenibacillus pasadenensis]|uniref:phage terminase small subunit n=1 Tax=Paenibacillus pasadenensis TaxID=217090 RepID=UPI002041D6A1|nr:phage terminase small subunit [Paenibacillus pasadenensis]MCM3747442.1 phage terminase small subunit [Paenibacillus pasadenensis]
MIHKKAEADYKRGMKYKEIAEKYSVSLNTVKSWKQRHGWERQKGAHKEDRVHTSKGAPPGNKNAVGNRGGAAPARNRNAVSHGFFQKFLPPESLEIMEELQTRAPIDILWENIMIQYTAIIRAQRIMYVKDQKDKTIERVEERSGMTDGEKWEVQHAWDKQATFLQAQSRAMATLQGLIRQYEEMCRAGWADEEQQLRLDKLKGEVAAMNTQAQQEQVMLVDDVHE